METKRVRLVFKNCDILRENQKSDGLNRCWVLLKPDQHRTIADISSYLLQAFQLHQSCPNGLLLSMDGFVLPPNESTIILKDKDLIRVRKREDALSKEGVNVAHPDKKLKALEKQPVHNSVFLLSNVEFEKGTKSDDSKEEEEEEEEEDDEDDLSEDAEIPAGVDEDSNKRKRKASETLQCSMKKKRRSEASETVASDGHLEKTENPQQDGVATEQRILSLVDKISGSNNKENLENHQKDAKLSDGNNDSTPSMKSLELQDNGKEIKDAGNASKQTRKGPSRSARRKAEKRQWLRQMAKIQKKNATSESESLRNWKEDQAKSERNKVNGQPIGVKNWKQNQARSERKEVDGLLKRLLQWKQTPGLETSNNMDKCQQRNQHKNAYDRSNRYGATSWHSKQHSGEEAKTVATVVRPGHIRFGDDDVEEEPAVPQSQIPTETFQCGGSTSKKEGKKGGISKCSFTQTSDNQDSNKACSETSNKRKVIISYKGINFDNLQPLCTMPKEGDVIAYRTLELSSSWIPEPSPYRVRKVSWCDADSGQLLLITASEYPIVSMKLDGDESTQPDYNSLYEEDEWLQIKFYSLVDVRLVTSGSSGEPSWSKGSPAGNENAPVTPPPVPESSNASAWDLFLTQTSTAKDDQPDEENSWGKSAKVQFSESNGWGENVNTVQPQNENSWGKSAKVQLLQPSGWGENVRTVRLQNENGWGSNAKRSWGSNAKTVQPLRPHEATWGNNGKKVHPLGENSWDSQNSGGKPWSVKSSRGGASSRGRVSSRGGAHGTTMSRWRNGN